MRTEDAIIRHIFQKENLEQTGTEELDRLLVKYPYLAHLHWLKAAKHKNDKAALSKAGLHAFYPGILQYYLSVPPEPETTVSEKEQKTVLPAAEKLPAIPALQPLYTEDYFAYTRTRLPEKIDNDKPPTMEQVKSFTGWLRMMKKPQAAETLQSEKEDEPGANGLEGEKSLKKEQVITESMAEIWVRHGRPEQAIHIYNKLILLNPEKKGYFAAKISALKKQ